MANRLAGEISPYLLQHADDPVEWYPWGEAAFEEARATQRPVMLSAGYSSCHWCHVMARESFRDPAVAQLLNESFISVKVDREERPDVDDYYMTAVQAMTGSGGWPMTVFLTPDGQPFHGGTYYPPHDRHGLPSFTRLLRAVEAAWRDRREEVEEAAGALTERLSKLGGALTAGASIDVSGEHEDALRVAVDEAWNGGLEALAAQEDPVNGGFGDPRGGPKFPPHSALAMLTGTPDARGSDVARRCLNAMATGGLYDHLAGGFFRYSVDPAWRVPHFEKMLYDNAQLLSAYSRMYADVGDPRYRSVALGVVGWLRNEMMIGPEAGQAAFYSALDADSEGEEGRYYAWTEPDFAAALGTDRELLDVMRLRFGVSSAGDFEGGNVLRLAATAEEIAREANLDEASVRTLIARGEERLLEARHGRVRPGTDDKVLTSWNGLLLSALATAGSALDEPELLELATDLARFLSERREGGRLQHVWRGGEARVTGLLEDHAFLGCGLLDLYRATLEPWLLLGAMRLADEVEEHFHDDVDGGYFDTAAWTPGAPARIKSHTDGATPSRYVAAARLVWWVGRYRSDTAMQERARRALLPLLPAAAGAPQALGTALLALREMASDDREVVLVGDRSDAEVQRAVRAVRDAGDGTEVVLLLDEADATGGRHPLASLALAEGRYPQASEGLSVYVCRGGTCDLPVHDAAGAQRAMLKA